MLAVLPGEIDLTNAGEVLALITAAFSPGVAVVIADLTATRFCDSAGLRQLLKAHQLAADDSMLPAGSPAAAALHARQQDAAERDGC